MIKRFSISLLFGYSFLYLPIFVLVIFSFNDSDRVQLFTHFSFRWYGELLRDEALIDATFLSLKIAVISASFAVILGLFSAMALHHYKKFRARALFITLLGVPIIIPEIIIGLCMLLFFITMDDVFGLPFDRGAITISIAHITLAIGYVTTIVLAQLNQDLKTLNEAAADLGATQFTSFLRITLPLIRPALISGWLLSFVLSFDDLIIATFVSGPGAKTLPMLIYAKIRFGVSPEINAVSSLIILSTFIIMSLYLLIQFKGAKHAK